MPDGVNMFPGGMLQSAFRLATIDSAHPRLAREVLLGSFCRRFDAGRYKYFLKMEIMNFYSYIDVVFLKATALLYGALYKTNFVL